jgi:hypothetical protein
MLALVGILGFTAHMRLVEALASCAVAVPECDDTSSASIDLLPAVVIAAVVVVAVLVVYVVVVLRCRRRR